MYLCKVFFSVCVLGHMYLFSEALRSEMQYIMVCVDGDHFIKYDNNTFISVRKSIN